MGYRVLVVEDEWLLAVTLRGQLESLGHEVVGLASTGLEAIEQCRTRHPDIVLMDVQMPKMDGLEATRSIMRDFPTCVVIVTGNALLAAQAGAAGAAGYVVKPLQASQIDGVLAAACRRFQARRDSVRRPRLRERALTPKPA